MDITPIIDKSKNIIEGYGEKSFKINGVKYSKNLLVLPDKIIDWDIEEFESLKIDSFKYILDNESVDILLIGCGEKHLPLKAEIHQALLRNNVSVETMTTGAACRTYNVLLAEGRNVATAIIKI